MALNIPPCSMCGFRSMSMTLLNDKRWVCTAHIAIRRIKMNIVKLTKDERNRLAILVDCLALAWPDDMRMAFRAGALAGFDSVALIRPKSIKSGRKDWKS